MSTSSSHLHFFSFYLLLLFISLATEGSIVMVVHAKEKTWCVAKPSSNDATLLENINYACSIVDCGILKHGGTCFFPNNLISHASVAMNLYYQSSGKNPWNCYFKASGLVTKINPSVGNCYYA